ncbi:unnamed protein product [Lactuca virosa]|uniref:Glycosyl hydrolase family 32 N-terminal domain-containing protein n=1 Tax=Lactuca virosa TaxID=75947 RepID=A0AAU9NA19_9ASTR|nr:unnamed protein product [Lactuca virosa]
MIMRDIIHYTYNLGENLTPRYKILSKMGEGTFGRVLECWDRETHGYVAIKVVRSIRKYSDVAMIEVDVLEQLAKNHKGRSHCVQILNWFDYRNHICILSNGKEVSDTSHIMPLYRDPSPKNQPRRPYFHLRPPKNWLNGPMYYKRVYHLFYQYNPYGAIFNKTILWGHSVSHDLVNWIHLKNAIVPTKSFDINSCW